jgi:hypothetical protein
VGLCREGWLADNVDFRRFLFCSNLRFCCFDFHGCEIVGATWRFITMKNKTYCVSKSYDCSDDEDLLKIIAILRKFKMILETRLLM